MTSSLNVFNEPHYTNGNTALGQAPGIGFPHAWLERVYRSGIPRAWRGAEGELDIGWVDIPVERTRKGLIRLKIL